MQEKILIVEDEVDIAETIQIALNAKGYKTRIAFNGLEAIEEVHKDPPDLILLDIIIPEMNGFQVCRLLKNDSRYNQIPIIMLTAKTPQSDRFQGIETGADEYITKPFDPLILIERVEYHLKQAEENTALSEDIED